jgi:hypothetical protein
MRRAHVFFGDDPETGSNTAGHILFDACVWHDNEGNDPQQVFGDIHSTPPDEMRFHSKQNVFFIGLYANGQRMLDYFLLVSVLYYK